MYFTSVDFLPRNKKKTKLSANCTGCSMNITCCRGEGYRWRSRLQVRVLALHLIRDAFRQSSSTLDTTVRNRSANCRELAKITRPIWKSRPQQLLTPRPIIVATGWTARALFLIKTSIIALKHGRVCQNNKILSERYLPKETFSVLAKSRVDAADIKATLETFLPCSTYTEWSNEIEKKIGLSKAR